MGAGIARLLEGKNVVEEVAALDAWVQSPRTVPPDLGYNHMDSPPAAIRHRLLGYRVRGKLHGIDHVAGLGAGSDVQADGPHSSRHDNPHDQVALYGHCVDGLLDLTFKVCPGTGHLQVDPPQGALQSIKVARKQEGNLLVGPDCFINGIAVKKPVIHDVDRG